MVIIAVINLEKERFDFGDLVEVMRVLRSPEGCPWDREQTLATLKDYLEEEAGEVAAAIDKALGDDSDSSWDALCEELGDLMLQVVFQAQLAAERGKFTIDAVSDSIVKKLIRRHPHVFGETSAATSGEVLSNWKAIKEAEKSAKLEGRELSAEDAENLLKKPGG